MKDLHCFYGLPLLIAWIGIGGQSSSGAIIQQRFQSEWHIDVYDHKGYVAAREWEYVPYVPFSSSLGELTHARISTRIVISEIAAGDDFRFRQSFFTGWNPVDYQYSTDRWYHGVTGPLTLNRTYHFSTPSQLAGWIDPPHGPLGHYYFESSTFKAGHTVSATAWLTFDYIPVPEPGGVANLIVLAVFCCTSLFFRYHSRKGHA